MQANRAIRHEMVAATFAADNGIVGYISLPIALGSVGVFAYWARGRKRIYLPRYAGECALLFAP